MPVGHPDFLTREKKQSETLIDVDRQAFTGSHLAGLVSAANWPSMLVVFFLGTGPGALQVSHFRDRGQTDLFATKLYVTEASTTFRAILPVHGQWVSFTALALNGSTADNYTLAVEGAERASPGYTLTLADDLLYTGVVSVPAGGAVSRNFHSPYFGPVFVNVISAATNWSVELRGRNRDGLVDRTIAEWGPNDGARQRSNLIMPPLRGRIVMNNADGSARNFNVTVVPAQV